MEHEPKISTPEAILWVIVGIIADIVSIVPLLNIAVAIIVGGLFKIYCWWKGIKNQKALFVMIIEWIPVLSILPAYTAVMILTIYIDRHPKIAAIAAHQAGHNVMRIKKARGAIAADRAAYTANTPIQPQKSKPANQPKEPIAPPKSSSEESMYEYATAEPESAYEYESDKNE